jgi:hypothetical protein
LQRTTAAETGQPPHSSFTRNARALLAGGVLCALLGPVASAEANAFTWDGSARDPLRPGVTTRWESTLSSCGDTSPFRALKVRVHQGQSPIRGDEYMVVVGRRQVRRGPGAKWTTLPPSDGAVRRAADGEGTPRMTLQFFLRFVDRGMQSRVRLRHEWRRADGQPGDADDRVFAKRTTYTSACRVP